MELKSWLLLPLLLGTVWGQTFLISDQDLREIRQGRRGVFQGEDGPKTEETEDANKVETVKPTTFKPPLPAGLLLPAKAESREQGAEEVAETEENAITRRRPLRRFRPNFRRRFPRPTEETKAEEEPAREEPTTTTAASRRRQQFSENFRKRLISRRPIGRGKPTEKSEEAPSEENENEVTTESPSRSQFSPSRPRSRLTPALRRRPGFRTSTTTTTTTTTTTPEPPTTQAFFEEPDNTPSFVFPSRSPFGRDREEHVEVTTERREEHVRFEPSPPLREDIPPFSGVTFGSDNRPGVPVSIARPNTQRPFLTTTFSPEEDEDAFTINEVAPTEQPVFTFGKPFAPPRKEEPEPQRPSIIPFSSRRPPRIDQEEERRPFEEGRPIVPFRPRRPQPDGDERPRLRPFRPRPVDDGARESPSRVFRPEPPPEEPEREEEPLATTLPSRRIPRIRRPTETDEEDRGDSATTAIPAVTTTRFEDRDEESPRVTPFVPRRPVTRRPEVQTPTRKQILQELDGKEQEVAGVLRDDKLRKTLIDEIQENQLVRGPIRRPTFPDPDSSENQRRPLNVESPREKERRPSNADGGSAQIHDQDRFQETVTPTSLAERRRPESFNRLSDEDEATTEAVVTIRRYNNRNEDGSFTFGYENSDGSYKEETRGVDCIVRGKYGYIDPDGMKREYTYISGNPCDPNEKDDDEDDGGITEEGIAIDLGPDNRSPRPPPSRQSSSGVPTFRPRFPPQQATRGDEERRPRPQQSSDRLPDFQRATRPRPVPSQDSSEDDRSPSGTPAAPVTITFGPPPPQRIQPVTPRPSSPVSFGFPPPREQDSSPPERRPTQGVTFGFPQRPQGDRDAPGRPPTSGISLGFPPRPPGGQIESERRPGSERPPTSGISFGFPPRSQDDRRESERLPGSERPPTSGISFGFPPRSQDDRRESERRPGSERPPTSGISFGFPPRSQDDRRESERRPGPERPPTSGISFGFPPRSQDDRNEPQRRPTPGISLGFPPRPEEDRDEPQRLPTPGIPFGLRPSRPEEETERPGIPFGFSPRPQEIGRRPEQPFPVAPQGGFPSPPPLGFPFGAPARPQEEDERDEDRRRRPDSDQRQPSRPPQFFQPSPRPSSPSTPRPETRPPFTTPTPATFGFSLGAPPSPSIRPQSEGGSRPAFNFDNELRDLQRRPQSSRPQSSSELIFDPVTGQFNTVLIRDNTRDQSEDESGLRPPRPPTFGFGAPSQPQPQPQPQPRPQPQAPERSSEPPRTFFLGGPPPSREGGRQQEQQRQNPQVSFNLGTPGSGSVSVTRFGPPDFIRDGFQDGFRPIDQPGRLFDSSPPQTSSNFGSQNSPFSPFAGAPRRFPTPETGGFRPIAFGR